MKISRTHADEYHLRGINFRIFSATTFYLRLLIPHFLTSAYRLDDFPILFFDADWS
jgi:hypothetical protein